MKIGIVLNFFQICNATLDNLLVEVKIFEQEQNVKYSIITALNVFKKM